MEPFIGQIMMVGFNFAPRGWALCDGQLLQISQNSALFSLLGTTYGGNGETNFGLPDLRGRVPLHAGSGPGLTPRQLGQKSGVEDVVLSTAQIPSHNHTAVMNTNTSEGNLAVPDNTVIVAKSGAGDPDYTNTAANSTLRSDAISVGNTGNNQPHTNIQPFQCVNFVIALVGLFPSRN